MYYTIACTRSERKEGKPEMFKAVLFLFRYYEKMSEVFNIIIIYFI